MNEIETAIVRRAVKRCVRAARVRKEKTGDKRLVRIQKRDGTVTDEERDVEREILEPAQFVEEDVEQTVYRVADGPETHEFTDLQKAEAFLSARIRKLPKRRPVFILEPGLEEASGEAVKKKKGRGA